jgi:hypothetical protein
MKKLKRSRVTNFLALSACLLVTMQARASEVDFSCMSYKVWPKSHISDQYTSYDIVIQNACPGSVYWEMCIERLDPKTHKVVETHNPTGFVDADKKARVNLNLNKRSGKSVFRNRFQEFYVDIGYAIDSAPAPKCHATGCEAKKASFRKEISANETAWKNAEKALAERIEVDCPDSGWDEASYAECARKTRESNPVAMEKFELRDQELREQMAAVDPENCMVHSGNLVTP